MAEWATVLQPWVWSPVRGLRFHLPKVQESQGKWSEIVLGAERRTNPARQKMSRQGWPILGNEKIFSKWSLLLLGQLPIKAFYPMLPLKKDFQKGRPKYLFCFSGETHCQSLGNPSLVTVLEKAIYVFHLDVKIFKANLLACTFLCQFWLPFPTHGDHLKDKRKRYLVLSFFSSPKPKKEGLFKRSLWWKGHCIYEKQLSEHISQASPNREAIWVTCYRSPFSILLGAYHNLQYTILRCGKATGILFCH